VGEELAWHVRRFCCWGLGVEIVTWACGVDVLLFGRDGSMGVQIFFASEMARDGSMGVQIFFASEMAV